MIELIYVFTLLVAGACFGVGITNLLIEKPKSGIILISLACFNLLILIWKGVIVI